MEIIENGTQKFTINTTGDSSAKYGNCESCGEHCTEVFHLQEFSKSEEFEHRGVIYPSGWVYVGPSVFGHKNCLEQIIEKRKKN